MSEKPLTQKAVIEKTVEVYPASRVKLRMSEQETGNVCITFPRTKVCIPYQPLKAKKYKRSSLRTIIFSILKIIRKHAYLYSMGGRHILN